MGLGERGLGERGKVWRVEGRGVYAIIVIYF